MERKWQRLGGEAAKNECLVRMSLFELASSTQHHQGDGPTSSLGPVSMGKGQRAVCSGGLVVEVEAAVLSKLGSSLSRVEEADSGRICLRRPGVGIGVTASVLVQPTCPQCSSTQLSSGCSGTVGLGSKMQQPWEPAHRCSLTQTVLQSLMDQGVGGWLWKREARWRTW